jgi:hypothetical protein
VDAVRAAIAAHAAATPERAWVLGRGWLYAPFPGGLPDRHLLDAIVPDRPAWMGCYDGHTGWANTAALRLAGVTGDTPDPPNGIVVKDADGQPTGVLKEEAQLLVERFIPIPSEADDRASVRRAIGGLHAMGITATQDAWLEPDELSFWIRVHADGDLALRFRGALIMTPNQTLAEWRDRLDAYEALAFPLRGGDHLDAGILKTFVDGVIEAGALRGRHERRPAGLGARRPRCVHRRGRPTRLAGRGARDRGSRGPARAGRLRTCGSGERPMGRRSARTRGSTWHPRPAAPGGAHRDDRPGRHPPLRQAGRGRVDAALPR